MKALKNLVMFCVFGFSIFGCSEDLSSLQESANFVTNYGGKPFDGDVSGNISLGENSIKVAGKGTVALLEETKDSVSIAFLGDFEEIGEINIKVRGRFDKKGFFLGESQSATYFEILEEEIKGHFRSASQELNFDGVIGEEKLRMTMVATFQEDTESFPKSTRLVFVFDVRRKNDQGGEMDTGAR